MNHLNGTFHSALDEEQDVNGRPSLLWYLLHSPDQYLLYLNAPAWLAGAVMAVCSALLHSLGLAAMRAAYEAWEAREAEKHPVEEEPEFFQRPRCFSEESALDPEGAEPAEQKKVMSFASILQNEKAAREMLPCIPPPIFFLGLLLVLLSGGLHLMALTFAPETTVACLGVVGLIINLPIAYGLLHERFSRTDVTATLFCVLGMSAAVVAMPRNLPSHLKDFPVQQFTTFCNDMTNNYGFMSYLICWSLLALICLNGQCMVKSSVRASMRAFTIPTLAGLFSSATTFLLKIVGTLVYHFEAREGHQIWEHHTSYMGITVSTLILVALLNALVGAYSLYYICQGARHFDCRFFVPASFAVGNTLMIVQGVLFFRQWEPMAFWQLFVFWFACGLAVVSVFFIAPQRDTIHQPASVATGRLLRRIHRAVVAVVAGAGDEGVGF
jgi:hypothetical protein